jgi:GNAT superfamily N-acetyltransferase
MPQTFSSPQVVCRPALPLDYADIREFCKGIWEGGDYVPEVWRHWFNDPNGLLITAEYNGRAIGCAKISLLADGQWWLEGFRVDPNYQGLKVGSRIHNYLTDWWAEHADGSVRLMTENPAVVHLCEKTGYTKIHELRGYKAGPIDEAIQAFSPATDMHEAAAFAIQSESLQLTDGLIDFGWRVGAATEHSFEIFSGDKASFVHTFYWWRDKQGLFSAWEDEEDGRRTLTLGLLACAVNDLASMLLDIRRLAEHLKFDRVFLLAFLNPQIISQLEQAGFFTTWENYLRLFERKHHEAKDESPA